MDKPKVGDTRYAVFEREYTQEVTISKVGRNYAYFSIEHQRYAAAFAEKGEKPFYNEFDKRRDFVLGYLWSDRATYEIHCKKSRLLRTLRDHFRYSLKMPDIPLEELESIARRLGAIK